MAMMNSKNRILIDYFVHKVQQSSVKYKEYLIDATQPPNEQFETFNTIPGINEPTLQETLGEFHTI